MNDIQVLTIREAAAHPETKIAWQTLAFHVRNGHCKARKTGKVWLIDLKDLLDFNEAWEVKKAILARRRAALVAARRAARKEVATNG
jgi:hypothetical protein